MSWLDTLREATPTWLGGTGGNLTPADQAALTAQGQASIEQVAANAEQYYGSDSEAYATAKAEADYQASQVPGDTAVIIADAAKRNGQCSLLSVVNGQADFTYCYPNAKWYALGVGALVVLFILGPYVGLLSGRRGRA